jgi:hypothetical protein
MRSAIVGDMMCRPAILGSARVGCGC